MNFSQKHRKSVFFLLVVMISVILLCAQSLRFHVHSLDHPEPLQQHDSEMELNIGKHDQTAMVHLSIDSSHADHHDLSVLEVDASPDTIFRESSTNELPAVLFALIFTIFILGVYAQYAPRILDLTILSPIRRFHLFPLLRAPPL